MIDKDDKIIITGAAGLVGQNLTLLLNENGYSNIIAIDKHEENLALLKKLNPNTKIVIADLVQTGDWQARFHDAKCIIILHAQITGLYSDDFIKNNITATQNVIDAIKKYQIPYTVHISSSVVNSVADDDYTRTKTEQEKLIIDSGIKYSILRPTLMFGWFDPKHLGWLARFMEKVPAFPIPGNGKYLRQPLYSRDFCRVIKTVMEQQPDNQIFDIVGRDEIYYIDMIREIKAVKKLKTAILKIPYGLFYLLLKIYALFNKNPPFTADQLKALTAGDYFKGIDTDKTFGIKQLSFKEAINETINHPTYSQFIVKRQES